MRIKVTGYLETDDMDPARGVNYKICDLEDIEAVLEP